MPWMPVKFPPGIQRDRSLYSEQGHWYDSSLVRFRQGHPERWKGWAKTADGFQVDGNARSIWRHSTLDGFSWVSIGTNTRFYMIQDDVNYDVTPIETTATLGSDPLDATNTSTTVTVNHTGAARFPGNIVVISGATTFAGIPAGDLNKEHIVATYIDDDTYTIEVDTAATSTASGGGASVQVEYLYSPGSISSNTGGGWGRLTWGEEEWGSGADTGSDEIGQWSQDNWGEDLVACIRGGPIFYWDATNESDRMVDILDLASADGNAPSQAEFIVASEKDRHLLAFGGTEYGSSAVAAMSVRWCDQENILNWDETDVTGTAGSLPLSKGSRFLAIQQTNREILAFTDAAIYSLQYIGAPDIYAASLIENRSDILSMNASVQYNTNVLWVGRGGFYLYDGRVQRLDCPVWDYFINRFDFSNGGKVYASTNSNHGEVIWFYQSTDGDVIDSYVTYNLEENYWTIGMLGRTVWLDSDAITNPVAVGTDGYIYLHDTGADDGSTSPPQAITAYIESAPFELSSEGSYDKGDRFYLVRRILPDVSFRDFDNEIDTPQMDLTLKSMDKPGGGKTDGPESTTAKTTSVTVEQFTTEHHVRMRGRGLIVRASSDTKGSLWRLGTPRLDIRPDGQR